MAGEHGIYLLTGIGDVAFIDGRPPALKGETAVMPANDNRVSRRLYIGAARVAAHPLLAQGVQLVLQLFHQIGARHRIRQQQAPGGAGATQFV
ncbi:MAG: hypothetical protein ACREXU_01775 [Gammaproteobacteria bacterium]